MRLFGTAENVNGILHIGGISVEKLRKEYGTPLYVMDQKLLVRRETYEDLIRTDMNFED